MPNGGWTGRVLRGADWEPMSGSAVGGRRDGTRDSGLRDTIMLPWTGERFVPGAGEAELAYEHYIRYLLAQRLAAGRTVLDLGCGEGYGAHLLAATAERVVGIDIAPEAIAHARGRYPRANLAFEVANATRLPFDGPFALVTCFEVIEHLAEPDQHALLAEVARVLAADGLFVVSTPNRPVYRALDGESGEPNPYHLREMDFAEFRELLARYFPAIAWYGQQPLVGNHLCALQADAALERDGSVVHVGRLVENQLAPGEPLTPDASKYFVAVCARETAALHWLPHEVLLIDQLATTVDETRALRRYADELAREREGAVRWAKELEAQLAAKEAEREQTARWAQDLQAQLAAATRALDDARARLAEQEAEQQRAAQWAQTLQEQLASERAEREQTARWANDLQAQLDAAVAAYRQLEQAYHDKVDALAALESAYRQLEQAHRQTRAHLGTVEESYRALEATYRQACDHLGTVEQAYRQLEHAYLGKRDELAALETAYRALESAYHGATAAAERLRQLCPRVSAIVLAYNGRPFLADCLRSVLAQDYPNLEVIVVDNASADGSAELVAAQFPQVKLIRNRRNLGYAGGNNVGIRHSTGEILCLVNQDVVLDPGCIAALVRALQQHPRAAIAGCKIYEPDGRTLQHAGGELKPNGLSSHIGRGEIDAGQYDAISEPEYVTGAMLALRRELVNVYGLLDERYFPAYFEETDLCVTARALGYRVLYVPDATLVHQEAASTGKASARYLTMYHRNRLRFVFKTFPSKDLAQRFLPFELTWARKWMSPEELAPLGRAYLRLLRSSPELAIQRLRRKLRRRVV